MKIYFHFSVDGFSNTYVVGPDKGGDAIIIDPGTMNVALLDLIESNGYYIRNALITHSHESHSSGLKTLCKIYDINIYAGTEKVLDFDCTNISKTENIDISGISVKAIPIEGHSADSLIFIAGNYMFTGDTFSAGTIGSAPSSYAKELLVTEIQKKILCLEKNFLVFPGHGAPSTLEAERLTNPAFADH
jgi:hydroxyacylglutathione hydrolase